MKKILTMLLLCLFVVSVAFAQAPVAKLNIEWMSPYKLGLAGVTAKWPTTSGLRVVGKGTTVWLSADTAKQAITSIAWTFTGKPSGSTAAFTDPSAVLTKFVADSLGTYGIRLTVNGTASKDTTIFASTYVGVAAFSGTPWTFPQCGFTGVCHAKKLADWQQTGHANHFKNGLFYDLEVDVLTGKGRYSASCVKCHTTAWDTTATADNGNFGKMAKKQGLDTLLFNNWRFGSSGYPNDPTRWNILMKNYPQVVSLATIGCEVCHGPGNDHYGFEDKIAVSLDVGVCAQCHDSPASHGKVRMWSSSGHAKMEAAFADNITSTSCLKCHSGKGFFKFTENRANPGYDSKTDPFYPITCSVCHDPHSKENPNQLRTMYADTLTNGWVIPGGGKGQLCMNCHKDRRNAEVYVLEKRSSYGPHHNNQADMFWGRNAVQFGDNSITGMSTHSSLEDACVTCHMALASGKSTNLLGGHTWRMEGPDSTGTVVDHTTGCTSCHGELEAFDDVRASADFDGNGKIEGVQTEVKGMLAKLASILPKNADGTVSQDSAQIGGKPNIIKVVYDYYFVVNDGSYGVHNAKYAVAILQKAIGKLTGVEVVTNTVPQTYALEQNYPNPFNPATTIQFSIPNASDVKLVVYSTIGEIVKVLANDRYAPGTYKAIWDGTNMNGIKVSSGLYIYRLETKDFVSAKKMIVLK